MNSHLHFCNYVSCFVIRDRQNVMYSSLIRIQKFLKIFLFTILDASNLLFEITLYGPLSWLGSGMALTILFSWWNHLIRALLPLQCVAFCFCNYEPILLMRNTLFHSLYFQLKTAADACVLHDINLKQKS